EKYSKTLPHLPEVDIFQVKNILSVNNHPAFIRVQQRIQMLNQHRFPASGAPDDSSGFAVVNGKVDIFPYKGAGKTFFKILNFNHKLSDDKREYTKVISAFWVFIGLWG